MKSSNETMTREEAIEVYNGLINTKIKEAFEFFAPELRESEDERMEKAIVDALLSHCNSINLLSARGYQIEDVKAWLEKQKEQKPPITGNDFGWIDELKHDLEHPEELDQKVDDVLKQRKGIKTLEWSEEDKKIVETICKEGDLKPSEKRWLKSLPERFNLQPKPEWSSEDEDFINMLILHFNYLIDKGGDSVETYKSYIEKLKSLRPPQYCENCKLKRSVEGWKPSEEQMRALQVVVDAHWDVDGDALYSLYTDLKKLM